MAEKRSVQLGRRIPGFVVIENGLDAGEAVITEGTNKVRDGSEVEPLTEQVSLVSAFSDPGV